MQRLVRRLGAYISSESVLAKGAASLVTSSVREAQEKRDVVHSTDKYLVRTGGYGGDRWNYRSSNSDGKYQAKSLRTCSPFQLRSQ